MKKIIVILLITVSLHSKAQSAGDTLKLKYDSLLLVVKEKNFRLNRVKFYLNICIRNPSQDKFLKGWIRRALK